MFDSDHPPWPEVWTTFEMQRDGSIGQSGGGVFGKQHVGNARRILPTMPYRNPGQTKAVRGLL
jgi:hypothetical protein